MYFNIAGGSVPGRDHTEIGKNNQDAFAFSIRGEGSNVNLYAAVVCDGCGSGKYSEVGASLGARLILSAILDAPFNSMLYPSLYMEDVRLKVLADLRHLWLSISNKEDFYEVRDNFLLFTSVGAVFSPVANKGFLFSIGDGLIVFNGEFIRLGPFPDNAPPYLAYGLGASRFDMSKFNIVREFNCDEMQHIILGTDGAIDLMNATDKTLPGTDKPVGSIMQYVTEPKYTINPSMITRHLRLVNREKRKVDYIAKKVDLFKGLLPDDTTVIAIRRED